MNRALHATLDRLEGGNSAEAGCDVAAPDVWKKVDQVLLWWGKTVPPSKVHRVMFCVAFEDGFVYRGIHVITREHFLGLAEHIRRMMEMISGKVVNELASRVRAKAVKENPRAIDHARVFLETYSLTDAA